MGTLGYIVCWRQKPRGSAEPWTCVWTWAPYKAEAVRQYNSLLPGPNGSFGPIEYADIRYCEVLSEHTEVEHA